MSDGGWRTSMFILIALKHLQHIYLSVLFYSVCPLLQFFYSWSRKACKDTFLQIQVYVLGSEYEKPSLSDLKAINFLTYHCSDNHLLFWCQNYPGFLKKKREWERERETYLPKWHLRKNPFFWWIILRWKHWLNVLWHLKF